MKGTVKYLSVWSPVMFKNMTTYDMCHQLSKNIDIGECKAGKVS